VLAIFFRVFSVKVRGQFIIFLYFLGIFVTVHPPLKLPNPFGPAPLEKKHL
jgi:hypothetical protein